MWLVGGVVKRYIDFLILLIYIPLYKNIASLKSDTGLSLMSTRGKLEVLQRHYQLLSKMSVDSVFDADWKEEVEENVYKWLQARQRKLQIPF